MAKSRKILVFFALMLSGGVLNSFFTIPLYANLSLHLGTVTSILAIYLIGRRYAILNTLLIGLPLGLSLDNFFVPLLVLFEVITICALTRFRWSVIYADLVFWLFLGMPTIYVYFINISAGSLELTFTIVTKQAINGLLYVSIASIVLPFIPGVANNLSSKTSLPRLRRVIQSKLETLIIGISILVGLFAAENSVRVHEETLNKSLIRQSKEVALFTENLLTFHKKIITELSQIFSRLNLSKEQQKEILQTSQSNNPEFISMLISDSKGQILMAAPEKFHETLVNQSGGLSVADREYFIRAMEDKELYVSDVFRGRGFGDDIIVAISRPIFSASDNQSQPVGIVEGSLNLKQLGLSEEKIALSEKTSIVLVDEKSRVIHASKSLGLPAFSDFKIESPNDEYHTKIPVGNLILSTLKEGKKEQLIFYQEHRLSNGWTAYLLLAPIVLIKEFEQYYILILGLALVLSFVSFIVSRHIGSVIAKPLELITEYFRLGSEGRAGKSKDLLDRSLTKINAQEYQDLVKSLDDTQQLQEEFQSKLLEQVEKKTKQLKETNQELTSARYAAEEASRLKSQFLANMSHEIRTPMNGVIGILELLSRSDINKEQYHRIELAKSSASSLLLLINDILDLSKIESGKLEIEHNDFDLVELVESIVKTSGLSAEERGNKLLFDASAISEKYLNGDSLRLRQVIVNLLSNAIKFTENGVVNLKVATIRVDKKVQLHCTVEDSGIGIPESKLQTLFDAFSQADASTTREYGGSGLGLTISRQICQLMSGDIRVESKLGEGSTFSFVVEMKTANDPKKLEIESHALLTESDKNLQKLAKSGAYVLVVEDNIVNQEVISGLMNEVGLKHQIADNGKLAIEQIELTANAEKFNLILMDCQMPVMDGYETTQKIRDGRAGDYYRSIPIIALTANAMSGDREKCLAKGMSDYLAKPIDSTLLIEKLLYWLGISGHQEIEILDERIVVGVEGQSSSVEADYKEATNQDLEGTNQLKDSKANEKMEESCALTQIQVWNKESALKRMLNKERILKVAAKEFLVDSEKRKAALIEALELRSIAAINANAHSLKGASANIGGEKLSRLAFALEQESKELSTNSSLQIEELTSRVKQVIIQSDLLVEQIKTYLKE